MSALTSQIRGSTGEGRDLRTFESSPSLNFVLTEIKLVLLLFSGRGRARMGHEISKVYSLYHRGILWPPVPPKSGGSFFS